MKRTLEAGETALANTGYLNAFPEFLLLSCINLECIQTPVLAPCLSIDLHYLCLENFYLGTQQ